ncbi:unnamed protein product, partial [Prorocentrum cordatum]
MDDRSLACSSEAQLDSNIQSTNEFDTGTSAIENESERQRWVRGQGKAIGHAGILAVPDYPEVHIAPATSWSKHPGASQAQPQPGSVVVQRAVLCPISTAARTAIEGITTWELEPSSFLKHT